VTADCPICNDAPGHHWLWRDDRLRVIDARDPIIRPSCA
jgi:hypothetical protein